MAIQKRSLVLSALALMALAPAAKGQANAWQRKWYWGAGVGIYSYKAPDLAAGTIGRKFAPTFGGHWMITGKRSALYIAFDQVLFSDSTTALIRDATAAASGGIRTVDLSKGRRIQATIFAIPMDNAIQIMVGGGFAIHQITDGAARGPFATLQEAINANNAVAQVDTKAFVVMAVGAQYRFGRWAAFGQYNFTPSSRDFLFTSDQHAITAGIRYALTSSHEEVSTER